MKTVIKQKAKLLALAVSLLSGGAGAANVTLYFHGTYEQLDATYVNVVGTGVYNAELTYDSAAVFSNVDNVMYSLGGIWDWHPNVASITVFANGQSDTDTIRTIDAYVNRDNGMPATIGNPGTHSYYNALGFTFNRYWFNIVSSGSPTALEWNSPITPTSVTPQPGVITYPAVTGFLPTPSNPEPFSSAGYPPVAYFYGAGNVRFAVDSYSFTPPSSVPVPAAAWLFGSALLGLGGMARRRK